MTLSAHPAAEAWPMLNDDELDSLAADIKANGLQQPIVIDGDGLILDGRNRHEACRRAGVEPEFVKFDGDDPVAFVLSCNEHRRHLSTGQRAIAVARTIQQDFKSEIDGKDAAKIYGLNAGRIAQANTIIRYAPDLADKVLDGTLPISTAYDEARTRKNARNSDAARLDELRLEAPDLAERVVNGDPLSEVWATYRQRQQDEEDANRRLATYARDSIAGLIGAIGWIRNGRSDCGGQLQPQDIARIEQHLAELVDELEKETP